VRDRATEGLLERDSELAGLRAVLEDARGGDGRFVLIEGVAGIGKTRLLRDARGLAEAGGLRVLAARGTEFEKAFPFGIVRQLFEPPVLACSAAERAALLADGARAAEAIVAGVPAEADTADLVDPAFARLNGLYWLLVNLADQGPVALLVDDVHWADRASQRFLRFLLPRLDGMAVAVIAAGRPDGEQVGELAADPAAQLIHPAPLSAGAVGALVRSALGAAAEDAFCDACWDACGGNPFLLGELLVELRDAGFHGVAGEAARVHRVAPRSVQRAVVARIDALGGDARAVSRAVAVLGESAAPALAAQLAGLDTGAVSRAADALATAEVLEPVRPLRFVHPLVRNAVYANLGRAEAAEAHEHAAALLMRDGEDPERIALHLLETEPGDNPAVVGVLVEAARRAIAQGVPDAAVRNLRRALLERAGAEARHVALRALVGAATRAMSPAAFEGIPEDLVDEFGDDEDLGLLSALAAWLHMADRVDSALRLLDRGIERADRAGDVRELLIKESTRVLIAQLPPTEAQRRLDAYVDRIVPGSPEERLMLALRSHWSSLIGDSSAQTADFARRAVADGRVFEENPHSAAPTQAPVALLLAEDVEGAERASDHWIEFARRDGSLFEIAGATLIRGRVAFVSGDVALAEARLRHALELMSDIAVRMPFTWAWLIEALIERDELDAAEEALRAGGLEGDLPEGYWSVRACFARGQLRVLQGRGGEAIEDLLGVGAYMRRSGQLNPAWMPWGTAAAPALVAAGRAEEARAVVLDELERARRWGAPAPIARALRVLAGVEGGDRVARMEEALAVVDASPVRLECLRVLCDLGTALRLSRRQLDAREPLRAALEEARRLGALAIARRAHEELSATGETVRPFLATGAEALTPSERRVAAMAAEGMSNREIAQTLFLTVKTVETHLSAAYRKLDIAGRAELGGALVV
jgi:DNA-binding CsgD family transcriptional regulator